MESKTAKKRFCSTLHRVYYNREKIRGGLTDAKIESVARASNQKQEEGNLKDLTILVEDAEVHFGSDMERELWEMEQKYYKQKK